MMSADIDPSLCAAEPAQDDLADGFSPPAAVPAEVPPPPAPQVAQKPRTELGAQSLF